MLQENKCASSGEANPEEAAARLLHDPKVHHTVQRRSWYSQTFSDDEDEDYEGNLNDIAARSYDSSAVTCKSHLRLSDACSEASTDVGIDTIDDEDESVEVEADGERRLGETTKSEEVSAEELEAMKLRRLQKRQRQRLERREHRAFERAQRSRRRHRQGPSLGPA